MKSCSQCGKEFAPRGLQSVCSQPCAIRLARELKKHRKAQERAERSQFLARKSAIKTIPQLIAEAQTAFNAYVRERDRDKPCICCGQPLGAGDVGGEYDCGHYRSTGSASHLRFHPDNAHAQRKQCNRWGAGRAVDYRLGLIARIGLERVEALENNNDPHKWTRDELIALRNDYKAKLKALKAEQEATA